jgi:hypothetical protein
MDMSMGIDMEGCVPGAEGWDADERGCGVDGEALSGDRVSGWVGAGVERGSAGHAPSASPQFPAAG